MLTSVVVIYGLLVYFGAMGTYMLIDKFRFEQSTVWFTRSGKCARAKYAFSVLTNLTSVTLMLLTIWQLKRLIRQLNQGRYGLPEISLREPVVAYHIFMLVV